MIYGNPSTPSRPEVKSVDHRFLLLLRPLDVDTEASSIASSSVSSRNGVADRVVSGDGGVDFSDISDGGVDVCKAVGGDEGRLA